MSKVIAPPFTSLELVAEKCKQRKTFGIPEILSELLNLVPRTLGGEIVQRFWTVAPPSSRC